MKLFPVLCLLMILSSCNKDKSNCVAKNSQGDRMYEVVGLDVCESQISTENGEYCDCEER
ncbi:hypothetical protein [Putridiphycobacter roseus]|uniref:hypothetical protein n=1 Tax=Putridiphycobacter roseus TaxID=2219161 RepID=UPI0011B5DF9E|nr:hypothetical protein [Putridiphycobacter roseus]